MLQPGTSAGFQTSASPQPVLVGGLFKGVDAGNQPTPNIETIPPSVEANTYMDKGLRWVKELLAGVIGITLVACLLIMISKAFDLIGKDASDISFQRVKDLLLFINPLVGVVIGYYFNRVSIEARAENAERTAQEATTTAQQAQVARGQAESQAQQAESQAQVNKSEANEARSALRDFIPAAETLLSQMPPPAPLPLGNALGAGPAVAPNPLAEARQALLKSLERARAITERA